MTRIAPLTHSRSARRARCRPASLWSALLFAALLWPGCALFVPRPPVLPTPDDAPELPPEDDADATAADWGASDTAPLRLDALDDAFAAATPNDFAQRTAESLHTFSLANGIPVIVRPLPDNRLVSVNAVFRGGAALTTLEQAGIEEVMLNTMMRASVPHSYDDITARLDDTSSGMECRAHFDYATCTLRTLDRYVDDLLPLFAAGLLQPRFDEADFRFILAEARLAQQGIQQDPWRKAAQVLNEHFFANHPYAARLDGTEASLANMTLNDVREHYARTFSANRMLLVVVGNVDVAALRTALEGHFGAIPDRAVPVLRTPPAFAHDAASRLVKVPFAASRGVAYLRGDFAAPAVDHPDYPALLLAAHMLNDLLFNVVRDQHGAAYSVGMGVRSFKANYGSFSVYKTTQPQQVKQLIDSAVATLAAGQVMSMAPEPDAGPAPRQPIAEAIDVYKAMYTNNTYRGVATTRGVASLLINAAVLREDPRAWLLEMDRVQAVTPDDIMRAVRHWLVEGGITWVVLGADDVIAPVRQSDFTKGTAAP